MEHRERHVRLFRNGRNQALRIPREFELEGDEAIVRKEGERLIVEPVTKGRLLALLSTLEPLDETLPGVDEDLPPLDDVTLCHVALRYLLDTNILSDLLRSPQGVLADRISEVGEDAICTSIVVAAELRFRAAKAGSRKLADRVDLVLSALEVLPFETPADRHYASLRRQRARKGTPIGPNDMLIAAHALAHSLTVVTANAEEFSRVAGLAVENWLQS